MKTYTIRRMHTAETTNYPAGRHISLAMDLQRIPEMLLEGADGLPTSSDPPRWGTGQGRPAGLPTRKFNEKKTRGRGGRTKEDGREPHIGRIGCQQWSGTRH